MYATDISRSFIRLQEAQHSIRDADLLLFRRRDLIAMAGRGEYSHAAKAAWWDVDLFCLEVREFVGGRAVTLSSQVQQYPGRIDVYEANPDGRWPEYDRVGATRRMRRLCGCRYGWQHVLWAALLHLPIWRWLTARRAAIDAETDDAATDRRPPFCSDACSMADRLGGKVDPVVHLADRYTEPSDLARSPFYRYRFTLVP